MRSGARHTAQSGRHAVAAALLLLMLVSSLVPCDSALNIGVDGADSLLAELRQSIFVDIAHLAPRQEKRCSSLDGPSCFGLLDHAGSTPLDSHGTLDGPGVLPERLLHDLGVEGSELEFALPGYLSLDAMRPASDDAALVEDAQSRASGGLLQFSGLAPDRRVPVSFSQGMPDGVVATWDGRWIARHCPLRGDADDGVSQLSSRISESDYGLTNLPVPFETGPRMADKNAGVVALATGQFAAGVSEVQASVEQASSLAYIRFSRPMIVRSLAARWSAEYGAPPAMIGGRLGMQNIWTVHLDPGRLESDAWLDVSGGTLQPVDELVFMGTQGLELGAIWVAGHTSMLTAEISERTVMLLEPVFDSSIMADALQPQFRVKHVNLALASAPFLMSVQEVIDAKLRLHSDLSHASMTMGNGATTFYPGMVSQLLGQWQNQPTVAAQAHQQMLEHHLAWPLMKAWPQAQLHDSTGLAANAGELVASLRSTASSPALPVDLRRDLARHRDEIVEAVLAWARNMRRMKSTGPSSEIGGVSFDYWRLKAAQMKLDLLTAAYLYAPKV